MGFAKLKDFIVKNPLLEIWNRGPNFPHVRLKKNEDPEKKLSRSSSKQSITKVRVELLQRQIDLVKNVIKMNMFTSISLQDLVSNTKLFTQEEISNEVVLELLKT